MITPYHYCVTDFGAAGDGVTSDTASIQKAIDAAAQGGTVYFPNGTYVTGTLYMRSNVTLYLERCATLLGSPSIEDYAADTHKQRYDRESHMDRCLIYAENVENITFTGPGTIDGQGEAFPNPGGRARPMLMRFLRCRNIRMNGLRLRRPASWTTAFILCDTVFAETLDIHSRANGNGDGLDFDSCRNVLVSGCKFDTSDDSICLQSSEKEFPCKNIVIQNCIMTSKWAAIRIGMMSSGDFEDVTVSNCVFHDLMCSGLKIQAAEGGHIRNMLFQNIVMRNVPRPIFLTFNHYRLGVDSPQEIPATGGISNLKFHQIIITNDQTQSSDPTSGIVIAGTPGHNIDNISISSVDYTVTGGGEPAHGARRDVPELTGVRPEYFSFGGSLPSYGVYIRHASGITIDNLKLTALREDGRPAVVCSDVNDLEVNGLKAPVHASAESFIRLENTRDARLNRIRPEGQGQVLLWVEGIESNDIVMKECRSDGFAEKIHLSGVPEHTTQS